MGIWDNDDFYDDEPLKSEDEIRDESYELVENELFDDAYNKILKDYNLKDYRENLNEWYELPTDDKIEYCYKLLQENKDDNFPILRQVDVFQKLVNLDFKVFCYERVLECAFFSYKTLDDIETESNTHTTVNISFHPLIPQKHYNQYFKNLRAESNIKSLNIPLDNAYDYLKELLYIWYLYSNKELNPSQINKEAYLTTFSDDKTVIRDNIKKIQKLIIPKQNLNIVNNIIVEPPQ